MNLVHDVVVVGGGAAGLSAALVLGRARRSTVLVDSGTPSNLPAPSIGGLLGHDRRPPRDLYDAARTEISRYPTVSYLVDTATTLTRSDSSTWLVQLHDRPALAARHVVLATGMRYGYPPLPGIDELWGRSVFHCPFCHGWEHRDQPLAVLGGGPATVDRTLLLREWTDSVTLITPPGSLCDRDHDILTAAQVTVLQAAAVALHAQDGHLHTVELDDGRHHHATGLLVTAGHQQRSDLAQTAGLRLDPTGHLVVDELGRTDQPGIWAVGDLTSPVSLVARSVATGALAATWITHALVADKHGLSFPPPGAPGGPQYAPALQHIR